MLSFGWSEIALVAVIIVIVVGPKEIPNLLKQLGTLSKSLRKVSRQFKSSLNELAEEGDLKDVKKSLSDIKNIKNDLDPTKAINKELKEEIETIKKAATFTDKEISEINSKIKKD